MGVDLFFSNHLEHLAEKLARNMDADRQETDDPFLPLKIIIPNTNLAKWLTLMLAQRDTIAMNLDFQFLEIGLWQMIAALDLKTQSGPKKRPNEDQPNKEQPTEWLDNIKSRLLILFELIHLETANVEMASVVGYLYKPDGQKKSDYTVRLWQLAERLAYLFQEYEYHRTDMIRRWQDGYVEKNDLARCEQLIYLAMIKTRNALRTRTGESVLSLMEYADQVISNKDQPIRANAEEKRIHLFGLSQVSAFHLTLIDRLTPYYDIYIYALNPSREFWEDIRTPSEKRWIKHRNPRLSLREEEMAAGELDNTEQHPLLSAWGKPGRESVRLLCQLTDYVFHAGFSPFNRSDNQLGTVLATIQNNILTLGKDHPSERLNQDRSLQIYGCPGIQREVETVYNNIVYNLSRNDRLQLTDFAILVPNITAYKPVFDQVFNRVPKRLTYSLIDSRADIESVYGQSVLGLLSLATERFSRKTVFELILNPCFMHKWQVEPDEVRIWAKWAESLNIFHMFQKKESPSQGAPQSGRFTFKQGLQRLRLARIFSSDDTAGAKTRHYQNLVPYADLHTSNTDSLEKFCLVVEALDRAATSLNLGRATVGQWRDALLTVCGEQLSIPPEYRGESAVQRGLFQALDNLSFFERLADQKGQSLIDATLISEYLRYGLGAISGGSGDYLTGGVTISELTPMRPIPFKIIYVLGMEEGGFPGREEPTVLDLRRQKRRIGDISLPEKNRYLFLETLLAAREKLYISYISRDLQKDRLLPPNTVVNQLKHFVEARVLPQGQSFQLSAVPLKSSSPEYIKLGAVTSWSDVRVNDHLIDRVVAYRSTGSWPEVQSRLTPSDNRRISRINPDLAARNASNPLQNEDIFQAEVQLYRLTRFLQNPIHASLQYHLGLFEDENSLEESIQMEDEPFASEYPLDWRLKMLPFTQWLGSIFEGKKTCHDEQAAHDLFDQTYAEYSRQSATPDGFFADIDQATFRKALAAMLSRGAPLIEQAMSAQKPLAAAIFGDPIDLPPDLPINPAGSPTGGHIKRFEPLPLSIPRRNGEIVSLVLHGHLRWLWRDNDTGWHVLVPVGVKKLSKKPSRHLINPLLFYLACLTTQTTRRWIGKRPLTIHLISAQNAIEFTFHADADEATEYLHNLVTATLENPDFAWLPFEPIIRCRVNPLKITLADINPDQRQRFKAETELAFAKKANDLERLIKPVFPENLLDQAVERFAIFGTLRVSPK